MAFVKDGNFEIFKNNVAINHDALEERVLELETRLKELTKNTIGIPVEEVVPEPFVVEEETPEEVEEPEDVEEEEDEEEVEEESEEEETEEESDSKATTDE